MNGTPTTARKRMTPRASTPARDIRKGDLVMWGGRTATITEAIDLGPTMVRLLNNHGEELDVAKSGPIIRVTSAARLRVA